MKIGVMTWWRNTNYGGFLQGLALQTFLQKRGYDVEMVKYAFPIGNLSPSSIIWPSRIRSVRGFFSSLKGALLALVINSSPFARMRRLRKTGNSGGVPRYVPSLHVRARHGLPVAGRRARRLARTCRRNGFWTRLDERKGEFP